MPLYSHNLNLRVLHPTLDTNLVRQTLGLSPHIAWQAGNARQTPMGTPLGGVRVEGYRSADPFNYGWRDSTDAQIEGALEKLVTYL